VANGNRVEKSNPKFKIIQQVFAGAGAQGVLKRAKSEQKGAEKREKGAHWGALGALLYLLGPGFGAKKAVHSGGKKT
jgi:hypothetical protein